MNLKWTITVTVIMLTVALFLVWRVTNCDVERVAGRAVEWTCDG